MPGIKNIALIGASGNLGPSVLNALLASKAFQVTVLKRESSTSTYPESVKAISVDFDSLESLTSALQGKDAVVSTLGNAGFASQKLLIDAAAAAGVKRFIPSEFGSNTTNPQARALPVYQPKIAVQEYLEKKSSTSDLTYTYIINGAFLDWGLQVNFLINIAGRSAELYDGGVNQFSSTTLAGVGKAVVGVLSHLEETKNRPVFVQEAAYSQNQLLAFAEKATPGTSWKTTSISTAELEAKANEDLSKGIVHDGVWYSYLKRAIFGSGYGGKFDKLDNDLLGIKQFSDAETEALVASLISK